MAALVEGVSERMTALMMAERREWPDRAVTGMCIQSRMYSLHPHIALSLVATGQTLAGNRATSNSVYQNIQILIGNTGRR